jgi:hypothetical protein
MRALILGLGLIVLLLLSAGLSYVFRVGPFAPAAAGRSTIFVAISRSLDPADAHEIDVINLDTGARDLFDVGDGPITALALSRDRRSLYVGIRSGKVVLLDATTGTRFGTVNLDGVPVASLVATEDDRTLFAFSATNTEAVVVPITLATKTAAAAIHLSPTAVPPIIRGEALVVAFRDAGGLELSYVDVVTRVERSRLTVPVHSLGPIAAFPIGDAGVGIAALDRTDPSSMQMRLFVVADPSHWRDVVVPVPDPRGQFGFAPLARADADVIHVCTAQGELARRYVITLADLAPTLVDGRCGLLSGDAQLAMAVRDGSQLVVLDPRSGKSQRTLPLAGVPVAVPR